MRKRSEEEKISVVYKMTEEYVISKVGDTHPFKDDIIQDVIIKTYESKYIKNNANEYGFKTFISKWADKIINEYTSNSDDIDNVVYTENNLLESIIIDELKNNLALSVQTLTEREQAVLYYRFYEQLTLEEIGNIYCLTGNRIREIEYKALRKMRHPSRSKRLRGYLQYFDEAMPYELK